MLVSLSVYNVHAWGLKIKSFLKIMYTMKVGFEPGTKPVPRPDEQLQYDTQTTTTTQVYNI